MKKWAPRVLLAAALAGLSAFLLKGDVWTFWTWWLLALFMGMVAMPVTGRLFEGFVFSSFFLLYQILWRRRIKSPNACLPIFMMRFILIEFLPA